MKGSFQFVFELVREDIKQRYSGSALGVFWSLIQPLITIFVVVLVSVFGLKGNASSNGEYLLWLVGGLLPWFFLSEATTSSLGSIIEKPFLVKKIHFRMELLPLIKILSACCTSFVFTLLTAVVVLFLKGSIGPIQSLLYFYISSIVLLFAFGLITSSINVFFRDFGNLVGATMQLLFWITPIFWSFSNMSSPLKRFLYLNPFFYLIEVYRIWIGSGTVAMHPFLLWSLYFWIVSCIALTAGVLIFKKLKIHFADVI